ncbi:DUF3168 domain-containing protein [Falsochrobactrum sp. TDYN1]|uniref:DUF3168 domain-containing protein n=1 Tax=Falsochrobactrum tianjinense TaxID=2706015 RepID=A0A949PP59_9HYPH|nr:DUF3168 domain-containing protein [Falsochrobactrum sp. TDYN1]MBV2144408.1 DUF3168 domain-containing protein [Falsochrobactrum sp. TDYN1]
MSFELALQKAIRARLTATQEVTALVPAANIIDRNARPNPDPSIILGEDQGVDAEFIQRNVVRVFHTIHVWKKEENLVGVKAIAGAIRNAISQSRFGPAGGFHFADCYVSQMRFLRDPDGETSHGVVTVQALVQEVA